MSDERLSYEDLRLTLGFETYYIRFTIGDFKDLEEFKEFIERVKFMKEELGYDGFVKLVKNSISIEYGRLEELKHEEVKLKLFKRVF